MSKNTPPKFQVSDDVTISRTGHESIIIKKWHDKKVGWLYEVFVYDTGEHKTVKESELE